MSKRPQLERRTFTLGLAGALAAAWLPARRAHARAYKIMVIGGSTIKGALGRYIEKTLEEYGNEVLRIAKSATGLARPDFYDWPEVAAAGYADFSPGATIVMFGGNDGQGLYMGKDADDEWVRWGNEEWEAEYRRRVLAFAELIAPAGELIFWVGMPAMGSSSLSAKVELMNSVFEEEMGKREGGYYLATRGLIPGTEGYAEHATLDGHRVRVRAADGVHYSSAGAKVVADQLVPKILDILRQG